MTLLAPVDGVYLPAINVVYHTAFILVYLESSVAIGCCPHLRELPYLRCIGIDAAGEGNAVLEFPYSIQTCLGLIFI
jgi:hypothetical protein